MKRIVCRRSHGTIAISRVRWRRFASASAGRWVLPFLAVLLLAVLLAMVSPGAVPVVGPLAFGAAIWLAFGNPNRRSRKGAAGRACKVIPIRAARATRRVLHDAPADAEEGIAGLRASRTRERVDPRRVDR